jgi:hypothetical protein
MNGNELEKLWKEEVVAKPRYSLGICLWGLRKTTKPLSHDSRYPLRDSKLESLEYKSRLQR